MHVPMLCLTLPALAALLSVVRASVSRIAQGSCRWGGDLQGGEGLIWSCPDCALAPLPSSAATTRNKSPGGNRRARCLVCFCIRPSTAAPGSGRARSSVACCTDALAAHLSACIKRPMHRRPRRFYAFYVSPQIRSSARAAARSH